MAVSNIAIFALPKTGKKMKQKAYHYSYELKIQRRKKITRNLLIIFFISLFLIILFKFFIFPIAVFSDSMAPDVKKNSLIYFSPARKDYERGDLVLLQPMQHKEMNFFQKAASIIVSYCTGQQVEAFNVSERVTSKYSIRRVIAKPGDTLYMKNYIFHIKSPSSDTFSSEYELASRDYTLILKDFPRECEDLGISSSFGPITLGEGQYFLAADNRMEAFDSRQWGPVKEEYIAAKAIARYFPIKSAEFFVKGASKD